MKALSFVEIQQVSGGRTQEQSDARAIGALAGFFYSAISISQMTWGLTWVPDAAIFLVGAPLVGAIIADVGYGFYNGMSGNADPAAA